LTKIILYSTYFS